MLCLFYYISIYFWSSGGTCHISSKGIRDQFAKYRHSCCIHVFHFQRPDVIDLLTSSPNIGGSCTGPSVHIDSINGKYLSGQCCGVLKNTTEYHEHLEKLKQYSDISDIPLNPYKTPVDVAKKWIDYDNK